MPSVYELTFGVDGPVITRNSAFRTSVYLNDLLLYSIAADWKSLRHFIFYWRPIIFLFVFYS